MVRQTNALPFLNELYCYYGNLLHHDNDHNLFTMTEHLYDTIFVALTVPGKYKLTLDPRSSRASGIADRVSILNSIDSKLNSILDARSSKNLSVWNFVDYAYSMRLSRKRLIPRRQNNCLRSSTHANSLSTSEKENSQRKPTNFAIILLAVRQTVATESTTIE